MRRHLITGLEIAIMVLFCVSAEAADWETDFEKASSAARTSGKYILLDFSGSDWCGWCMKLEKEVFNKDDFKDFTRENLVCVLVDFPRYKKQSEKWTGTRKQNKYELLKS